MKKTLAVILALVMALSAAAFAAEISPQFYIEENVAPTDAMVHVCFDCNAGDVTETTLKAEMYEELIYDTVDANRLAVGDTINIGKTYYTHYTEDGEIVEGDPIVKVETLSRDDDGNILINGGIDAGGITLVPYEGGTYYVGDYDDIHCCEYRGTAEFALADNIKFVAVQYDDEGNVMPEDINITCAAADLANVLKEYQAEAACFDYYSTVIFTEGGKITEINVNYMP